MNFRSIFLAVLLMVCTSLIGSDTFHKLVPSKFFNTQHSKRLFEHRWDVHNDALLKIKTDFNISDSNWHFYIDFVHDLIKKDDLFSGNTLSAGQLINSRDHWLTNEAKKVLIEYGINLDRIIIKLDYSAEVNGAASQEYDKSTGKIKHVLILNPDWFSQFSINQREAILRHEIMHFAHYDGLEESYVLGLLMQLGYKRDYIDSTQSLINYRVQRETRADLLSVVEKPSLIYSEHYRFNNLAKITSSYPNNFWKTHPDDKTRANNMSQLLAYINRPALIA